MELSLVLSIISNIRLQVYLLQQGKKVHKKKTSCKRGEKSPTFNEAMIFNVPAHALQVKSTIDFIIVYINYQNINKSFLFSLPDYSIETDCCRNNRPTDKFKIRIDWSCYHRLHRHRKVSITLATNVSITETSSCHVASSQKINPIMLRIEGIMSLFTFSEDYLRHLKLIFSKSLYRSLLYSQTFLVFPFCLVFWEFIKVNIDLSAVSSGEQYLRWNNISKDIAILLLEVYKH